MYLNFVRIFTSQKSVEIPSLISRTSDSVTANTTSAKVLCLKYKGMMTKMVGIMKMPNKNINTLTALYILLLSVKKMNKKYFYTHNFRLKFSNFLHFFLGNWTAFKKYLIHGMFLLSMLSQFTEETTLIMYLLFIRSMSWYITFCVLGKFISYCEDNIGMKKK